MKSDYRVFYNVLYVDDRQLIQIKICDWNNDPWLTRPVWETIV
jgi:hypothetical protein